MDSEIRFVRNSNTIVPPPVAPTSSKKLQQSKCQPGGHYKEFRPPKDWANAPEFIPKNFTSNVEGRHPKNNQTTTILSNSGCLSYAEVVGTSTDSNDVSCDSESKMYASTELCPYAVVGECRYGEQCLLVHGTRCDYCMQWCIHPFNAAQREAHKKECIRQHERDMELSFAVAQSTEKTCGICMEVVVDKTPVGEQRFGILPSCNHCFCLSCIRRWRQARQFENKIIRACPECRITSDFVCPSRFWVETKTEKDKLIGNYKIALSNKACRYYRTGAGTCPFGNKCFYLHALPNGTKVDVGPPRRRPRRETESGVSTGDNEVSIWEFLEDWELQWMDVDDFMDMIDSDEADMSDDSDMDDMYLDGRNLSDGLGRGHSHPYPSALITDDALEALRARVREEELLFEIRLRRRDELASSLTERIASLESESAEAPESLGYPNHPPPRSREDLLSRYRALLAGDSEEDEEEVDVPPPPPEEEGEGGVPGSSENNREVVRKLED